MVYKFLSYNISYYDINLFKKIYDKIKTCMSSKKNPDEIKPVEIKPDKKKGMFIKVVHKLKKIFIRKKKQGGESKQLQEIIKTKERVVVRYENVKYKRNVLIKNNKRYVKINKKLILIS